MATVKLTPRRGLEMQAEILTMPLGEARMAIERLNSAISRLPDGWSGSEQFNVGLIRAVRERAECLQGAIDALRSKLE